MSKIKNKIKDFFNLIGSFLYKYIISYIVFGAKWVYEKLEKYLGPILSKIGHFLTHNYLINITPKYIRVFGIKFRNTRYSRNIFYGFSFISLWLIGFLIFTLYPLFYSLYLSFTTSFFHIDTGITSKFIGFTNYLNIIKDQTLAPLYVSYIGKILLAVPLVVIFSMIIAMLINQPIKGKGLWRTIFFLPVIISTGPVINELQAQGAVSLPDLDNSSLIVYITNNLGSFIADPVLLLLNNLLLVLWYAGIPILIFLAALQKIDPSIYEASSIDGASPWDNFWKITLPSLKPFIVINIIYIVVSMSLFVEPGGILELARIHMNQGNPQDDTLWKGYGYAAAMAWIYFLLMVVIMGIYVGIISIRKKESR